MIPAVEYPEHQHVWVVYAEDPLANCDGYGCEHFGMSVRKCFHCALKLCIDHRLSDAERAILETIPEWWFKRLPPEERRQTRSGYDVYVARLLPSEMLREGSNHYRIIGPPGSGVVLLVDGLSASLEWALEIVDRMIWMKT